MRSICVGAKYLRPFRANHNPLMANQIRKFCFLKKKIYEIRRTATKALMRELGDILTRTSSPKVRERGIYYLKLCLA